MKKRTIIALYGAEGVGKTSTLSKLIGLLKGETIDYGGNDKLAECCYKEKKIIVTTAGDGEKELTDNLLFVRNYDWDIAITATRTKEIEDKNFRSYVIEVCTELIWKEKKEAIDIDINTNNLLCAKGLLKNIDDIIYEREFDLPQNYHYEPSPEKDGIFIITYKKSYKTYLGSNKDYPAPYVEYELIPYEEEYNLDSEAQARVWDLCGSSRVLSKYVVLPDGNKKYVIHRWNCLLGKYEPIGDGYKNKEEALRVIDGENSDIIVRL